MAKNTLKLTITIIVFLASLCGLLLAFYDNRTILGIASLTALLIIVLPNKVEKKQ